jgi:hypothetical protein
MHTDRFTGGDLFRMQRGGMAPPNFFNLPVSS